MDRRGKLRYLKKKDDDDRQVIGKCRTVPSDQVN